ncbi:hypothetical protein [Bacillus coahuilensis]|nr:hypothetical protein [Bacillus coahuilensis]
MISILLIAVLPLTILLGAYYALPKNRRKEELEQYKEFFDV